MIFPLIVGKHRYQVFLHLADDDTLAEDPESGEEFGTTASAVANSRASRELLKASSFSEMSLLSDWPDDEIYRGRVSVVA